MRLLVRTLKYYLLFPLVCNFCAASSNDDQLKLSNRLYQSFGPGSDNFSGLLVSGVGMAGGIVGTAIAATQAIALYKHMKKLTSQDQAEYNQSKIKYIVCTITGGVFCILSIASAIIFVDKFKNSYQEFKSTNRQTLDTQQSEPFVLIPPLISPQSTHHAEPDPLEESPLPSEPVLLLPITTPETTALLASLTQEAESPGNNSLPSTQEENESAAQPADIIKILNTFWICTPEKQEGDSLIRITLAYALRTKNLNP